MISDTTLYFRWVKIITVGSLALMSFLIVIGNTTDYYANYYFVEHVMKMDTIFRIVNCNIDLLISLGFTMRVM